MGQDDADNEDHEETERARSALYRLLGRVMAAAPDAKLLAALGALDGDRGALGEALRAVAAAARDAKAPVVQGEYDDLFVGIAHGEVVPYASFYLTGFLYERPLARVREDMAGLGLAPADGRADPEDHIATLLEIMSTLIDGGPTARRAVADQHAFFRSHIGSWASRFFDDLMAAPSARLYRPLAALGRLWIGLEQEAFLMESA